MSEEAPSTPRRPEDFLKFELQKPSTWKDVRSSLALSFLVHLAILSAFLVPWAWLLVRNATSLPNVIQVRFHVAGEGPGGGGGGGGSDGSKPTAYVNSRAEPDAPVDTGAERQAPVAPRPNPPLRADSLKLADAPSEISFDAPFSPDAVFDPGLSSTDPVDYGGVDMAKSAGAEGGLGGGKGTGVGPGSGWGVGPGEGGGFGGGKYRPGGWDVEPVLKYKPLPDYPPRAKERFVRGEVILEVLVRTDGSTEVLRVLKSLPDGCVEAAIDAARNYRWKPALKSGKPVEAVGIVTVRFNLLDRRG